jgi:hypothetical protein
MIPEATIVHRLPDRLRLKIGSQRGNADYFQDVENRLGEALACRRIAGSACTGSLVIEDEQLDFERVCKTAGDLQLFSVDRKGLRPIPLAKRITDPIRGANRQLYLFSGGVLDLPGIIFLLLIAFGLYELARGNFRRPPWYTFFWYAFGLFSKILLDQFADDMD